MNDQSFMAEISTSDIQMDGPDPSVRALRALVAASPALDPATEIVVCIPCFRRPQYLRRTLESLAAQRTSRRFAVVMVENDASKSESVPVATEYLAAGKFAGLCVIEPRQGNCHAINAAFETALQMFPMATSLLMIDDDEIASPDWLEQMVRTASATGADIVGGPVFPEFEDERKRGLRRHPAFAPAYDASGPVPVIYGCGNCLIRRSVFTRLGMPAFDLRFNFLGGGDTDFFYRGMRLGLRFHWIAEAVISRDRAAKPHQPEMAGDARPADRRDQLSRPAQGDADGLVAGEADRQIAGGLAAFFCLCRVRAPERA